MVMEAATLSTPQRKHNVVPVQKSLSLPSYARAGGEGIDHKLIFAALEQKEKIRRKSKIFTREKTARQNIFCLPISTGAKCKETSLSSDTSCSSLEYQPKPISKPKKEEIKCVVEKQPRKELQKNERTINEPVDVKSRQLEIKANFVSSRKDIVSRNVVNGDSELNYHYRETYLPKSRGSPIDYLKPNVGSSGDSMERSSRSSSDSLSRKERLVAIKAKVEAARQKYGESSSEDESRSSISRYNSDGVIHRTVREVKSKSSRNERRIRRRSQDEWAIKKTNRKSNLSLCLTSVDDEFKMLTEKPLATNQVINNSEYKTDFCPSPNFPDLMKKNYFSDFPSNEIASRVVQARIKQIEEEERKRRSGLDFLEKTKLALRQSPQNPVHSSPISTEHTNVRHSFSNQNASYTYTTEKNVANSDPAKCMSPVPRSPQAPTPPPRSPKSMTFVNKAFIQHQNSSLLNQEHHSLERKKTFQPNIQAFCPPKLVDRINSTSEAVIGDTKNVGEYFDDIWENHKIRELLSSRRQTCSNFEFSEKNNLDFVTSPVEAAHSSQEVVMGNKHLSSFSAQKKSVENKGYFSSSETPAVPDNKGFNCKLRGNKWEENERRREFMFNSLESRKKTNLPPWLKPRNPILKTESCHLRGEKLACGCNHGLQTQVYTNVHSASSRLLNPASTNISETSHLATQYNYSRLSKSEANLAFAEKGNCVSHIVKSEKVLDAAPYKHENISSLEHCKQSHPPDDISATANLESAMEELESVYRSLKFSSDNLSDKNGASNAPESDDDVKIPKQGKEDFSEKDLLFCKGRVPVRENYTNSELLEFLQTDMKLVDSKSLPDCPESSITPSVKCTTFTTNNKNSISKPFCIDELFSDLTRQLDIEHKLLKESRDSLKQNQENRNYMSNCNNYEHTEQKSISSPISTDNPRKELYGNAQKINADSSLTSIANNVRSDPNKALARKKYKAVRSLSANISYLMANANSDAAVSENSLSKTGGEILSSKSTTTMSEKPLLNYYEHVFLEPFKPEAKQENILKQTHTSDRTNSMERKNIISEIRQIRVSMDSQNSQPKPIVNSNSELRQYPLLSSAVSSNQAPPKCDITKRSHFPMTGTISKENVDAFDEVGLEELLNTLLGDVPEPKQSSLLLSKDVGSTTPPPVSAGEMRVLQHLDIIRLKPVPS